MRLRMGAGLLAVGSLVSLDQRGREADHLKLLAALATTLGQSLAGHRLEGLFFGMLIH